MRSDVAEVAIELATQESFAGVNAGRALGLDAMVSSRLTDDSLGDNSVIGSAVFVAQRRADATACRFAALPTYAEPSRHSRAFQAPARAAGRDTDTLAHEFIAAGFEAFLVCVDPRRLDPSFAGRRFDAELLADLPPDVDPCGENGEFHTFVYAGPVFSAPIDCQVGATLGREGFVFCDGLPADA